MDVILNHIYLFFNRWTCKRTQCIKLRCNVVILIVVGCPPNYGLYDEKCYYVQQLRVGLEDARSRCERDGRAWAGGGNLVSVKDHYQLEFIRNLAQHR